MVMKLLEIREILLKGYQKARVVINPVFKFLLAMIVFKAINTELGFDARLLKNVVVLLLSAISAVTPGGVMVFLAMVLALLHIYAVSKFVALFMLLTFIVLYCLLLRFTPKQALIAVALPVMAKYNLHYAIPIVCGMNYTPLAILPTTCGVIIYYLLDIIKAAATRQVSMKLDDVLQLYIDIVDAIMANRQMVIMICVFAAVITVVYIIRRISFEFSFEIAVGAGVVVNIIGFLFADLKYNVTVNVGTMIIMSIVGGLIAMVIHLWKRVLDYTAIERVQFEDDDYYYYVKAVPKVNVTIPKLHVQHFNDDDEYEEDEYEEEDPEFADAVKRAAERASIDEEDYGEDYEEDFDDDFSVGFDSDQDEYDGEPADSDAYQDPREFGFKTLDDEDGYEVEMTLEDEDED